MPERAKANERVKTSERKKFAPNTFCTRAGGHLRSSMICASRGNSRQVGMSRGGIGRVRWAERDVSLA